MKRIKRLVFINQVANYLAEDIVTAMLEYGGYDEVVMLVGNPQNIKIQDKRIKIEQICRYDRSSIFRRTQSWIVGTLQCQWKILTKYHKDKFFIVSNPPTTAFLKFLPIKNYSVLIYDIYPDGLVSGGFISRNNILYRIWSKANKKYLRNAENVFTIADSMVKPISAYISEEKIKVVPIWYNSVIHKIPREENEFIKEHKLQDKFIVMYSGNIGRSQNVELLPDIAYLLKDKENIQFIIIGDGRSRDNVVNKIKDLDLQNVMMLPYQPSDKISHSIGAADVSYISLLNMSSTVCVPSKTYNCLAVGSALLCVANQDSEIAKLVQENNVGKVFSKTQLEEMSKYLVELSENPTLMKQYNQASLNASELYSSKNALKFI